MSVRYFQADPHRNRAARRVTFAVSLLLHAGLFVFLAFYRMPGADQPLLTPFNVVELEPSRGPRERGRPQPPAAEPAPPRREAAPPPARKAEPRAPIRAAVRVPAKPQGKVAPVPAPSPTPAPAPAPAPSPLREELPTIARKPENTPPPVRSKTQEKPRPSSTEVSEEALRERLKAIRERVGTGDPGTARPQPGRDQDVSSSIERIRAKVGEPTPTTKPPSPPASRPLNRAQALVGEAGVVDGGSAGSVIADMRFAAYRARLWSHVKAHWSLPPSLAGRGLSTVVVAAVTRNGVVSDAKVEISSGVEAFDLMALRALLNSSPLPEVPPDIPDSALGDGLGFRFTESGAP